MSQMQIAAAQIRKEKEKTPASRGGQDGVSIYGIPTGKRDFRSTVRLKSRDLRTPQHANLVSRDYEHRSMSSYLPSSS